MVYHKISEIICSQLDLQPEEINENTEFVKDLVIDSLEMVEIMMAVEDSFDLPETDSADLTAIVSIGDLVRYIETHSKS